MQFELDRGSREPLYHYWMAAVFRFFGVSQTSARLASALAGIATVVAFHALCRQWLGGHTAFIAAALLAVARWHVTMSRVGLPRASPGCLRVGERPRSRDFDPRPPNSMTPDPPRRPLPYEVTGAIPRGECGAAGRTCR